MKKQKGSSKIKQNNSSKKKRWVIRGAAIGAAVAAVFFLLRLFLFPPYKQPEITGSLTVKTAEYTWEDTDRTETFTDTGENRSVTVKCWYPEEAGSYPLVVFSHGAFGVIDSNYSTCMELASNGYVAVSIAHPYHAMFVKDVNGKVTTANPEFLKQIFAINNEDDPETEENIYLYGKEWMKLRVADEHFVLNTILSRAEKGDEAPFSLIDTEKIGLFGHSMGGASSVQLGRERNDIGAVIDLEGTMLGEYVGFENGSEIFNDEPYPVPLLDVNSRAAYEEALSIKGDGYVNFYVGEKALCFKEVIFNDAGHLNFTDLPLVSPVLAHFLGVGNVNARECIENVNRVVLNWFDYYLKGKGTLEIKDEYC